MVTTGLKMIFCAAVIFVASASAQSPGGWTLNNSWSNVAIESNSGTFVAQFDAVPSAGNLDAVMGFSDGPASAYSSIAAAVRFSDSGFIDARNGGTYSASTAIACNASVSYRFRLLIDVSTRTYSAYVTPAGGAEQLIGSNYNFRTEQSSVARLNNFVGRAEAGGTVQVSSLTVDGSGGGNQSPTVQITSPATGASFVLPVTIIITASASDPDGSISRVDFYDGSTLIGSDPDSPYSLTVYNPATGSHSFTARAMDNAGGTATSGSVNVTVQPEPVETASVTLAWDPSPSADIVDYRVYIGRAEGDYTNSTRAGNVTRHTVSGLEVGQTYYFAVTALSSAQLESEFSNSVSAQVQGVPTGPTLGAVIANGSFHVTSQAVAGRTYSVDVSEDLVTWDTLTSVTADPEGRLAFSTADLSRPMRFFRLR